MRKCTLTFRAKENEEKEGYVSEGGPFFPKIFHWEGPFQLTIHQISWNLRKHGKCSINTVLNFGSNLENRAKQRLILVSSHFYLIFRQQVKNIEGDPAAEAE